MDQEDTLDIAIIGMSARFPGAKNIDAFWDNLRAGKESIQFFTDDELADYHAVDDPEYVKAAPVLDDIDKFDASFFGYAPREAQMMDPQHRLLLECAASALEHAGYASNTYDGLISVFAGSAMNTYLLFSGLAPHYIDEYLPTLIGNDKDFLATRISYKLNLKGPSVTVQTACSTALVATHMACQSLLNGESDIALAGAVSVRVPHNAGHQYIPGSVFTPDGHCRPFDKNANGTIFGSGVGVVVLKRLDNALEEGDYIHAVIKGTAINNDGASKVDYTAPSVDSQSDAIAEALGVSGVDASTVSYVEAHGTGTAIGDPIEVAALTRAFKDYTEKKEYCAIGSVKSNIGHLDVAAGMAGLIKTILALKHRLLPATLHYAEPNPEIDFSRTPFFVNNTLQEWNPDVGIRRAGVSALGIGGTNAHVILEEAPERPIMPPSSTPHLVPLSAKSEEALQQASENLKEYFIKNPDVPFPDVAFTLQKGRNVFEHKRFLIASTTKEAIEILDGSKPDLLHNARHRATSRELIFMFPGQGAQYINMSRDLYEHHPAFHSAINECASILQAYLSVDITTLLYPAPGQEHTSTEQLTQTAYTQPALFTVSYAMASLLQSWGIEPQAYIGHSIGEYVAACLSGVFTLEDALKVIALRGRLMQKMPSGSMLVVSLSEKEIAPFLNDVVSLAAVNGPELCVVSGPHDAIDALEATFSKKNIQAKRLRTSHGFHSFMMQPAADEFAEYMQQVHLMPPKTPFISNITGTWITPNQATDPQYWADHLRNPVQFEKGIRELVKDPYRVFLEVGPGRTLSSLLRMHPDRLDEQQAITTLRHPNQSESDLSYILKSIGQLWLYDIAPDWSTLYPEGSRQRIPVPTYPFTRQSHWFEPSSDQVTTSYFPGPKTSVPSKNTLLYAPGWKRTANIQRKEAVATSTWLLFVDGSTFSKKSSQMLKEQGHTILTAEIGPDFKQISSTSWTLNPKDRSQYDQLLQHIKQTGFIPNFILHLWNVSEEHSTEYTYSPDTSNDQLHLSFFSLLYLAQALQQQEYIHPITLGVLSSNAHDVLGTERINPFHATLHGPCRVIEKEIPNIRCVQIDLECTSQPQPLPKALINYLVDGPEQNMLAYRGKHCWIPEFTPVMQGASGKDGAVQKKGVYLITGGMGGLGLAFATWLAQEYNATLLLLGRSPMPEKTLWASLLNDPATDSKLIARIRSIQQLESLGAHVDTLQADVTHSEDMQAAIEAAHKKYGAINGVIHAAGIIEDALLPLKDSDSAFRVLAPKILGTLVLAQVLKPYPLDFMVLCSSINSYFSPAGQFDYTAANGFQDAFAYAHRQATDTNTVSINWPGWKETGMLADKKEAYGEKDWFKKEYNRGITTHEGISAFAHALTLHVPQLVVSKENIRLEAHDGSQRTDTSTPLKELHSNGHSSSSPHGVPFSEYGSIEEQLQSIWSQVLGLKQIGIHDDFFEIGGHSLLAVTLFKRMEQAIGALHLPISALIQAPTIAKFAPLIEKKPKTDKWSPLVKIQEGNSSIPLFCVHGAGGNILIYRELAAHLGPHYTVYGLESQGLDGKQPLLSTISEMAAQYVKEVRNVHPQGPYLLIGYCMGGSIALEMAQQLKEEGSDVSFLGLLETYNWINLKPENTFIKARYLWQKIEFHTRNLLLLPRDERKLFWQDKLNTLKRRRNVWKGMRNSTEKQANEDQDTFHHTTLANVWKNNDDAALVYQPTFYDGSITHFRPQKEYDIYSASSMRFDMLAREVITRILPVYPAGMMVPPFVSVLSDEIRSNIDPILQKSESNVAV